MRGLRNEFKYRTSKVAFIAIQKHLPSALLDVQPVHLVIMLHAQTSILLSVILCNHRRQRQTVISMILKNGFVC